MNSTGTFVESAKGGPGGWGSDRISKIPEYKQQIIDGITKDLFISEICQNIGITPATVRKWRHEDKIFDEMYTDAESQVTDTLEKSAITRARDGVTEPLVAAGKLVVDADGNPVMVRKYSDGLLQFLLKGRRRDVYGDKRDVDAKLTFDVVGAKASLAAKFAAAAVAETVQETANDDQGND